LITGSIGINTSSLASNVFLHAYSTTNTQINVETAGGGESYSQYTLKSGTGAGAAFFLNNASRTGEAGGNMATIRNDVGSLRLQSAGGAVSASLGITVLSGSGYVGMGINSPAYQLDVTGIAHVYGESLRLKNVNGSNTGVQFWNAGGTRHWSIFEQFGASGQQGSLNFENNTVGNVPMLITSGGIIGINTPSPDSNVLVHISYSGASKQGLFVQNTGSDEATIRFKSAHSADSDFRIGASILVSNSFEIYSVNAAASRLCINSSGSLGVKTTSIPNFSSTANILKVGSQAMFGYFGASSGGETWILNNAYFDGSWKGIYSSTSAQIIKLNDNNEIRIFNNAGVTANTTFTPTQVLTVATGSVVANQLFRVRAGQSADTITDSSALAVSINGTSNWVAVLDRNSTSVSTGTLLRNGRNTSSDDTPFLTTEANHPDCGGTSTTPRHRLYSNGNGKCTGAWTGGGADYAEYFEWVDGNPNNENRVGYPVSLVNNKIKIAEAEEIIIGIISASPSVIGDDGLYWKKKFLTNDLGEYILDEDGGQIVNPEYDPNIPYVERGQRKEWAVVGLMGKIRMKKGQLTMSSWIKMRDISDTVEEWLIK
jgi:hypothetical protein